MIRMERRFQLWDSDNRAIVPITGFREGSSWKAICPRHDDRRESLWIDDERGIYNCFGCGFSGKLYDPRLRQEAPLLLRAEHQRLLEARGHYYSEDTLKNFGFRSSKWRNRIDEFDIISYSFQGSRRYLVIKDDKIDGSWRSLPGHKTVLIGDLSPRGLVLVEGEHDMFCAWQEGLKGACCVTGGAMCVPSEGQLERLTGKNLAIIYDHDPAGHKGAERIARATSPFAHSIKIVRLPTRATAGAWNRYDLTAFYNDGGSTEQILEQIGEALPLGQANFRELISLLRKITGAIRNSNVTAETKHTLLSVATDMLLGANIYDGHVETTFPGLAERYGMTVGQLRMLLERNLGMWGFLRWESTRGRKGITRFALTDYPKVRFWQGNL